MRYVTVRAAHRQVRDLLAEAWSLSEGGWNSKTEARLLEMLDEARELLARPKGWVAKEAQAAGVVPAGGDDGGR